MKETYELFQFFKSGQKEFFSYWSKDSLIIFPLHSPQNKRYISLKNLFIDSFGSINSYYIHNLDSIFILQELKLSLYNDQGTKLFSKPINPIYAKEMYYNSAYQYPIHFDPKNKALNIRRLNVATHRFDPEYFNWEPDAYYLFDRDTIVFGKIRFPEKYLRRCYGDLHNYFKAIGPDCSVYSFESDENIYVEARNIGIIKKIKGRSKFQGREIASFDPAWRNSPDKIFEHMNLNPMYLKIMFDEKRNLYYRFFWRENDPKDKKGHYTVYTEKELILMVLDKNFNTVLERNLGKQYRWYYSFVGDAGVYIMKKIPGTKGDREIFDVFEVVD